MAIEPNARRRLEFERRIAAALINGEAKLGRDLSLGHAQHHARHVADVLWPLFTDETKAIGAQSQAIADQPDAIEGA